MAAILAIPLLAGCVGGSLATNTGARASETWSNAPRQLAVSGETVQLSFVLKKSFEQKSMHAGGLADYCIFEIDGGGVDATVNELGAFRAEFTLDDRSPGDFVEVKATAYRIYGARDRMRIADEWVTSENPNDERDKRMASAAVVLEIYQPRISLTIPHLSEGIDLTTARLVLHRRNGSDVVVYPERPPRAGFTLTRRDVGGWLLEYAPSADQINPTGVTPIEFSTLDQSGQRHEFNDELLTP